MTTCIECGEIVFPETGGRCSSCYGTLCGDCDCAQGGLCDRCYDLDEVES